MLGFAKKGQRRNSGGEGEVVRELDTRGSREDRSKQNNGMIARKKEWNTMRVRLKPPAQKGTKMPLDLLSAPKKKKKKVGTRNIQERGKGGSCF